MNNLFLKILKTKNSNTKYIGLKTEVLLFSRSSYIIVPVQGGRKHVMGFLSPKTFPTDLALGTSCKCIVTKKNH